MTPIPSISQQEATPNSLEMVYRQCCPQTPPMTTNTHENEIEDRYYNHHQITEEPPAKRMYAASWGDHRTFSTTSSSNVSCEEDALNLSLSRNNCESIHSPEHYAYSEDEVVSRMPHKLRYKYHQYAEEQHVQESTIKREVVVEEH
jgi:hypothetical protein